MLLGVWREGAKTTEGGQLPSARLFPGRAGGGEAATAVGPAGPSSTFPPRAARCWCRAGAGQQQSKGQSHQQPSTAVLGEGQREPGAPSEWEGWAQPPELGLEEEDGAVPPQQRLLGLRDRQGAAANWVPASSLLMSLGCPLHGGGAAAGTCWESRGQAGLVVSGRCAQDRLEMCRGTGCAGERHATVCPQAPHSSQQWASLASPGAAVKL